MKSYAAWFAEGGEVSRSVTQEMPGRRTALALELHLDRGPALHQHTAAVIRVWTEGAGPRDDGVLTVIGPYTRSEARTGFRTWS